MWVQHAERLAVEHTGEYCQTGICCTRPTPLSVPPSPTAAAAHLLS